MTEYQTPQGPVPAHRLPISVRRALDSGVDARTKEGKRAQDALNAQAERIYGKAKTWAQQPIQSGDTPQAEAKPRRSYRRKSSQAAHTAPQPAPPTSEA